MKTIHFIIAMLTGIQLTVLTCKAQTNQQTSAKFQTVLVTNWVKPGMVMREVNGQLYNTVYSKLWNDVCILSHSSPRAYSNPNPHHWICSWVEVERIDHSKITCSVYETEYAPDTYTGAPMLIDKTFIKNIIIYHYPDSQLLTTGQIISGQGQKTPCRCMQVSNYISGSVSYEAYDYGIQSTKLVPVITKVKVANTNSVGLNDE